MGLLSFLRKRSLPVEWDYQAKGIIWRLLPSENGLFIGEDRSPDRKDVSFFCLQQATGTPLWKDVMLREKWWIGLEAIYGQTVFLHEYTTPDMPEHKKIIAVDLQTGKSRWVNEELTFLFARDRFVYGKKNLFDSDKVYELDIEEGNLMREIDRDMIPGLDKTESQTGPQIEFPRPAGINAVTPEYLKLLFQQLGIRYDDITGIEYLEHNDVVVVGSYELADRQPGETTLRHNLWIAGRERGDIRFSDCLSERAAVAIPELFFRIGDRIHYIKEKRNLRSLHLQPDRS